MAAPAPTVSIGIPTFERGPQLDRAVRSALAQTVTDIEVVISDNASTDDTPDRCAAWRRADDRVRVVRHPRNIGPTANFNSLFAGCRGEHVLLLSDDDWLDAEYVERCLAVLDDDPALVAAGGSAVYLDGGRAVRTGPATTRTETAAADRVLRYFRAADDGPFYGVVRREALRACGPMPNVLANDWLHVGRLLATGRVRMLDGPHVNRSLGGTSTTIEGIVATFGGRSGITARIPHLVMAWHVLADVGWRSPAHRADGPAPARAWLAARCAVGVIDWASLAWHLTAPTMLGLDRRPRGRPVAQAYLRLTRALGAGGG